MKTFLLPEQTNWQRANLHCHTTISDGSLPPEEVKALYLSRGYSVVAYSDHERFIPHPELCDERFLALPSVECNISINDRPIPLPPGASEECREFGCYHFNLLAVRPDASFDPIRSTIWGAQHDMWGDLGPGLFVGTPEERDRKARFSRENIADFLETARKAGFVVQVNHPYWSLNTVEDCLAVSDAWALEILNWATQRVTAAEYCPYLYDLMLQKRGPGLFCTMADDNHNRPSVAPEEQSFGGSTFIAASAPTFEDISRALLNGDFYCASGICPPRFHALWVEEGKVHAEFSPVNVVSITGYGRRFAAVRQAGITCATLPIPANSPYFRLTLTDAMGNHANTHAYATPQSL